MKGSLQSRLLCCYSRCNPRYFAQGTNNIIIRYVLLKSGAFKVEEKFLQNCRAKTGDEIAKMIIEILEIHGIPLERGRA